MNAYHRILSTHFTNEEIQTILEILPLLQDPSNRELGFQLLKGANLYDSFFYYIVQYATTHQLRWIKEEELWDFMFSTKIRWLGEGRQHLTHNWTNEGNIILPPFAKELALNLDTLYGNMRNCKLSFRKISISNLEDVNYPIKTSYNILNSIELPLSTYSVTVWGIELLPINANPFSLYKNIPRHIKRMNIINFDIIGLGETLKLFGDLEYFKCHSFSNCKNLCEIEFPDKLKSIDFVVSKYDFPNFCKMVENCIDECPLLNSIILRRFKEDCYSPKQMEALCQTLWNKSFNLIETSSKDGGAIMYQFAK